MTGFQVRLIQPPPGPVSGLQVWVYAAVDHEDMLPVWIGSLQGLESDLLVTLVSEAVSAWAYGESRRDLQRACAAVKRQAKVHAITHGF